jgi:membrane protease YdiL (CAAX protease family)
MSRTAALSESRPARARPAKRAERGGGDLPASSYFRRSELPLTSLAFLLPLMITYELGTSAFTFDPVHQTEQRIIAFTLMQRFFLMFGATGKYMPALAVALVLLAWHVARRDKWKIRPAHVAGMGMESLVLAIPLIVISRVAERYLAHVSLGAAAGGKFAETKTLFVLSLGAGVYEELIFRLVAFTVLSFLLIDVFEMRKSIGSLLVVLISAAMFSAYHYLGDEPFRWWTFAFRALAGLYFGIVFLCRGFGITAGSHAAYDLCVVALRAMT